MPLKLAVAGAASKWTRTCDEPRAVVSDCRDEEVSVSRQHESVYRTVELLVKKEKLVNIMIKFNINIASFYFAIHT